MTKGNIYPTTWLLSLSLACLGAIAWSCSTAQQPDPNPDPNWENITPASNNIPNLSMVEPGIWRGGQPEREGFAWLKAQGITNIVKLNSNEEGSELPAQDLGGFKIKNYPIGTMEQLWDGPNPAVMNQIIAALKPPVFIHCQHGEDRTGLSIGLYRLQEGWPKEKAWQEMKAHGYHDTLLGLDVFWARQPDPSTNNAHAR